MLNNMTKCDLMLVLLRDFHNERSAAIRCDRLAALLDVEPRQVQRLVHKLRHEGHPICRDADGYYYANCLVDDPWLVYPEDGLRYADSRRS